MSGTQGHTLEKKERLSSKTAIGTLMSNGRWGGTPDFKFCFISPGGEAFSRILISVPKKNFKRAVKRNLLKRRIRESYRLQKDLLNASADILFIYNSKEVLSYDDIKAEVADILRQIEGRGGSGYDPVQ